MINRNIKFVQQSCPNSCGIACVAMVSGTSFDDVTASLGVTSEGIGNKDLDKLLVLNNILPVHYPYSTLYDNSIYIIAVPSLNNAGGMHYVVVTTFEDEEIKVFDPNKGKQGINVYETFEDLVSWSDPVRCIDATDFSDKEVF